MVFYHCTYELFAAFVPAVRTPYLSLANDGTLAVYVFFVLSGVVLTQAYLRTGEIGRLQRMALARYPRLVVPIAGASFICLVLMKGHLLFNHEAVRVVGHDEWLGRFYNQVPGLLSWARFSLYGVFFDYDVTQSYGSFLWTMSVEIAGSFLLFGMAALGDGSERARVFYYAVGGALTWRLQPYLTTFIYGMMIGEMLTLGVYRRLSRRAGEAAGIGLFALSCAGSVMLRGHYGPHKCGVLAACVVRAVCLSPTLRRVFGSGVSRWLGRLSFPLYLMHSFVICSYGCFMMLWLNGLGWGRMAILLVVAPSAIGLSLLAAWLFSPVERAGIVVSHWFAGLVLGAGGIGMPGLAGRRAAREPV